jgi:hypothetical protein
LKPQRKNAGFSIPFLLRRLRPRPLRRLRRRPRRASQRRRPSLSLPPEPLGSGRRARVRCGRPWPQAVQFILRFKARARRAQPFLLSPLPLRKRRLRHRRRLHRSLRRRPSLRRRLSPPDPRLRQAFRSRLPRAGSARVRSWELPVRPPSLASKAKCRCALPECPGRRHRNPQPPLRSRRHYAPCQRPRPDHAPLRRRARERL